VLALVDMLEIRAS